MKSKRTPARKKAKEIAKLLRAERPDYGYLKRIFQCLRQELDVTVTRASKKLPDVPTEQEIERFVIPQRTSTGRSPSSYRKFSRSRSASVIWGRAAG